MRILISMLLFCKVSSSVIYNLDERDYDRMPPLFELDEYHKCLRNNDTYCLLQLTLHADDENGLFQIIQEYSNYKTKHYNYTIINRGLCVRRSCGFFFKNSSQTKVGLEGILGECLNETIFKEYGLQATVKEVSYCNRDEDPQDLDVYQIIAAIIFMGVLVINLVGSIYDVCFERNVGKGNPYILSFSITRNWQSLVMPVKDSSKFYRLRSLSGVRALCMSLTILGHVILMITSYVDNTQYLETYYDTSLGHLLSTGTSVVQIFFMLSALLMGYMLLVEEQHMTITASNLPKRLLMRWWRLTPLYSVILLFICTWLERLGSGPLWSSLSVTLVKDCRRYWWLHILYLNSYVPGDACLLQTWHVATDMQLFTLSLFVMVVLRRWRVRALLVLLAGGLALPAATVWTNDLDARFITSPEMYRTFHYPGGSTFDLLYKPAHTNILCYVIGLLASILCHRLEKTSIKIDKYKFLTPFFALLIPAILALFATGSRYYDLATPAPLVERAAYTALMHAVLGAFLTVTAIGLILGYEAGLCWFLQWRGWTVPARLSYALYLVHFPLIQYLIASRTTLQHASSVIVLIYFVGVYGVSLAIALALHLLVEAPCENIAKVYFRRDAQREKVQ